MYVKYWPESGAPAWHWFLQSTYRHSNDDPRSRSFGYWTVQVGRIVPPNASRKEPPTTQADSQACQLYIPFSIIPTHESICSKVSFKQEDYGLLRMTMCHKQSSLVTVDYRSSATPYFPESISVGVQNKNGVDYPHFPVTVPVTTGPIFSTGIQYHSSS